MLAIQDRMTVAEFERLIALPENADRVLELFNGEIIETMPKPLHSRTARRIAELLYEFLKDKAIGEYFPEIAVRLPADPDNGTVPDVAFVRHERVEAIRDDEAISFVPDLCIEVHSPGQTEKHLSDKAAYYLAHGGRMVWVVYPEKGIVEWFTPTERRLLIAGDAIDGGEVLPGFSVTVAEVLAGK